ncbi:TonB-linked SusC/RagA family outer membrane protein [Catalinimonas alkaloidigena]|uniref:SusC/RagA family TonB-linked outer membrane protein n=1 Tax=Catalinimonas alkaloidigena TaxID=1075417 RepID=UPI0024062A4A|nr:TonB-dependent receptor [Catalinimonas alkaloidigena]MDF9799332.1 TonB-linked SusC/RagA family outer membrane protein [Catalinimonas alkaloidigena]
MRLRYLQNKHWKIVLTATAMLLLVNMHAFAQEQTISGKVNDENGDGLPGVNILVKGTTVGTVTDIDGNYKLTVSENASTLVFSSIGFTSEETAIDGRSVINVELLPDVQSLSEVVVVGYGTQKKTTLTGSISQVSGEVLQTKGTSSAAQSLQGEVPGVVVTRTSSRPGQEGLDIKIRGDISVNGVSPLVVLDGLIIPEWQLSTINPNDIESISVLKDAAAAIYGTRAAGGVILVTTKKGKQGKVQVDYSGQYQLNFANDYPLANLNEWAQLWLEAGDNDNIFYRDADGNEVEAASNYRFFTRDELVSIIDGSMPMAPESYFWLGQDRHLADVNQYDAVYGTTSSQRHNLSLSGGNESVVYRTSFGYNNERSPIDFVYDGAKRFNFRTNLSYQVNDMLSSDFSVSYDDRLIDGPLQGVGEGVQDMYIFPMYNPLGQYYDTFGGNNMLAKLDEGGRVNTRDKILRLGGKLNLDLDKHVKGLSFSYDVNVGLRNTERKERKTSVTMYDWEGNVSYTPTTLLNSFVKLYQTEDVTLMHALQGNYRFSLGKNNFGLTVGATAQKDEDTRNFMSRSNMASDELDHINTGDITTAVNGGSVTNSNGNRFNTGSSTIGLVSYLGRLNYDYNGIYLFEALARRDGSSRLHPDFRWKNFYGASAGIRLSEMRFMQEGFFDNLKLRASYGETGSVTGIGAYDYISNMGAGSTIFGAPPSLVNTAWISGITTTNRTWERVSTINTAIDFTILNNRLNGTAEYFIRENNDMLVNITYPLVLGANAPKTNSGDFTTKGWEVSLNWNDRVGSFNYNIGLMAWDSRSEVSRMEGANTILRGLNSVSDGEIIEGKPLNPIYTYVTDGILTTEEEVLDYYNQYGFASLDDQNSMKSGTILPQYRSPDRLVPGTVKRVDVNEDGVINEDDLVYFGDANPHYSFGIRLGAQWKGFDFSAFFQGVARQNILREGGLAFPFSRWWMNQNSAFLGQTWSEDNRDAPWPAIFYNGHRKNWNYGHPNDINVVKASYLRAKVLSLGYTLPQDLISRAGIDRVRFSLTANDLFVISNVKDGMDPEQKSSAHQGDTVPYVSTLIFGFELTF